MSKNKSSIDKTLANREKLYGNFAEQAVTAQGLKTSMYTVDGYGDMEADQREALEIIMSKVARILHGDSNYADSWHDIAGYALLIERRLVSEQDNG